MTQAQIDADRTQAALESRVKVLEARLDRLASHGLSDLEAVSGSMRFGGNVSRLDGHGMQFRKTANPSPGSPGFTGIFFVPSFYNEPGFAPDRAYVDGIALAGGATVAALTAISGSSATDGTGGKTPGVFVTANNTTGDQYVRFRYSGIFEGVTADPALFEDGMVWYRSDTDILYARINGVSVNIGGAITTLPAGGTWKVFYADGSGVVTELALGAAGTALLSNGASSAPSFGSVNSVGGVIPIPQQWAGAGGYEFWLQAGSADLITASGATNISGLDSYGWTTTALGVTVGSGADFLSAADLDPVRIVFDASADTLTSPPIFGTYEHGQAAARFLGATPTTLNCEFYARFTTATANENPTFLGFTQAGALDASTPGVSAGAIVSDSANFKLRASTNQDVGAAIDNNWHLFKISVGATNTEWFIDGASQGTITTETDVFPVAFKARAGTTNRIDLSWVRVFYA